MENEQNPVVKRFQIFGLHGYKDVTIEFTNRKKIIIAENGSGKTTILSALYAFLRSDYSRLSSIKFERIVCTFFGDDKEIFLDRNAIASIAKSHAGETMKQISRFSEASTHEIYEFITTQYRPDDTDAWKRTRIAHDLYLSSPFDWDEVKQHFDELKIEVQDAYSDELKLVNSRVASNLSGFDLLYLPTYRRVEKPVEKESLRERRQRILPFSGAIINQGYAEPGIRYGLDDVQTMLIELSQEIQQRTNAGYRKISREIIDDLLAGGLAGHGEGSPALPELDVLKRFFSRVGDISDAQVERIEQVYSTDFNTQNNSETSQLVYFLSKLATVVHETYQLEATIEKFTAISNAYLESTSDPKALVYDPVDMTVSVIDSWTNESLELNDLSSGEKQVVSLIAHLYLEPRDKIVLIDEPELSLSIEWQKRILLDIARSPRCAQLLAITHSPFVFDNEMDNLASSLDIRRRRITNGKL